MEMDLVSHPARSIPGKLVNSTRPERETNLRVDDYTIIEDDINKPINTWKKKVEVET